LKLRGQFIVVTLAKFGVAGLNVLFVYLVSRRLTAVEAGAFFTQFSAVMLVAAFCGLGAGVVGYSVVSPAMNAGAPHARPYSALLALGLAGIAAAALLYGLAVVLGWLAPVNPAGTGVFLVGAAVTLLMADLNRSAGDVTWSILLQGAAPMAVMLAALLAFDIRSAEGLFGCAAVSFAVAALSMVCLGRGSMTRVSGRDVAARVPAALRAAPLPAVSNMQVHAEIVLASQFLGPAALGVFVLANRCATLVRMPALIAFRVFAPSMDDRLAASLAFKGGDRSIPLRMFGSGVLLLALGLPVLLLAERIGLVTLPPGFYAFFAVCVGVKVLGLLPGSPESVLVARGRFGAIYVATLATLAAVVAGCLALDATHWNRDLAVAGLVSSWFVLQRLVMLWTTR
jgi:hypothetical protein